MAKNSGKNREILSEIDGLLNNLVPGQVLPTDKVLAVQFNCSSRTITRIMEDLKKKGSVLRVRGKGTFKAQPSDSGTLQNQTTVAQNIKQAILQSIARGEIRLGETLPQVKTVSLQYHVHPSSVISAYRMLCHEGFAEQVGKRYWLGSFHKVMQIQNKKQIYIITNDHIPIEGLYSSHSLAYSFRRMENELHAKGYVIEHIPFTEFNNQISRILSKESMPHGLILVLISPNEFGILKSGLMKVLNSTSAHLPNVLLLHQGHPFQIQNKKVQRLWFHGSTLTALSRKLAYFILEKQYDAVNLFCDTNVQNPHTPGAYLKIRGEIKKLLPNIPFHFRLKSKGETPEMIEVLRKDLGKVNLLKKYDIKDSREILQDLSVDKTFFLSLPESSGRTLWIFCRTKDAANGLQFCRDKGIVVPDEVSILGLTNDPEYFHTGISTCVEDWDTMGYLMAHSVIGDIPIEKSSTGLIRTPALILERNTT